MSKETDKMYKEALKDYRESLDEHRDALKNYGEDLRACRKDFKASKRMLMDRLYTLSTAVFSGLFVLSAVLFFYVLNSLWLVYTCYSLAVGIVIDLFELLRGIKLHTEAIELTYEDAPEDKDYRKAVDGWFVWLAAHNFIGHGCKLIGTVCFLVFMANQVM